MLKKNLIKENTRLKEKIEWQNKYIKDLEEQSKKYWDWYNDASLQVIGMQKDMLEIQVQQLKEIKESM